MSMRVLIVGGGGREHALAWKAAQSPEVERVYVAPGNAGTALEPHMENVPIAADDVAALCDFAQDNQIDLTIVGPEAPLVAGIVDAFQTSGLRCFGPSAAAAQLEGSKAFTKAFLRRHGIPTAASEEFTDLEAALAYIARHGAPLVVKADGLAAGKGVILAQSEQQALDAAAEMLAEHRFGSAGQRIVIEDFLTGEEASFIVMVDGQHILPMATSQDHKARDAGDTGPNTGGMGAYSPAPVVTPAMHERIMREVIEPTVQGLREDGIPYTGFLYAGLMIAADGTPNVLEFNCRFGDPETQPIMLRLKSDLVRLCSGARGGRLNEMHIEWDPRPSLGVVMAAGGYPDSYRKGDVITGLPEVDAVDTKVFHAGTTLQDGQVVTAGGRVLCACALGDSVTDAQDRAYRLTRNIHWEGVYYRSDIGHRAIAREQGKPARA